LPMGARGVTGERLLALRAATCFVSPEAGRIARVADPARGPGPRWCLWGSSDTNVAFVRHDVGDATARALLELAAGEPPLARHDSTPVHAERYVELLEREAPVVERVAGLTSWFAEDFGYEHGVALVASDAPRDERERLGVGPDT